MGLQHIEFWLAESLALMAFICYIENHITLLFLLRYFRGIEGHSSLLSARGGQQVPYLLPPELLLSPFVLGMLHHITTYTLGPRLLLY